MTVTKAHLQKVTLHEVYFYPAHEPRKSDPHYKLFNRSRAHMKKSGNWRCWVTGKTEEELGAPLEAHHHEIEFALANGIDPRKFEQDHPEFAGLLDGSEEAFLRFVESEHNIMPLSHEFHTGHHGIHVIPGPVWDAFKDWHAGQQLPGVTVPAK